MKIYRCVGGIGNQMFIYASARAEQLRSPEEKVILVYDKEALERRKKQYKYDLTSLNIAKDILLEKEIFENVIRKCRIIERLASSLARKIVARLLDKGDSFENVVLTVCQPLFNLFGSYCVGSKTQKVKKRLTKNLICEGYFLSAAYFDDYKSVIQSELKLRTAPPPEKKELLDKIHNSNSVCVHIRKGDYDKFKHYQVCTLKYYNDALNKMIDLVENPIFFVFSDNINWCMDNIDWGKNTVFVSEAEENDSSIFCNPFADLQMMYECKHFIISNSTFSWWAQYLSYNDHKIVIAPDRWKTNKIIKDIYQDNWIVIKE